MIHRTKESGFAHGRSAWITAVCLLFLLQSGPLCAFEIEMPMGNPLRPVQIQGSTAYHWKQGSYDVWHVLDFRLKQGETSAESLEAILWIDHQQGTGSMSRMIAYMERNVCLDYGRVGRQHGATGETADSVRAIRWVSRFHSSNGVRVEVQDQGPPRSMPAIYERAREYREALTKPEVQLAQHTQAAVDVGANPPAVEVVPSPQMDRSQARFSTGMQDLYVENLNSAGFNLLSDPDAITGGHATLFKSGTRITIRDVRIQNEQLGTVTLSADQIVVWHPSPEDVRARAQLPREQRGEVPIELYLEGNIILRQGRRVIYAKQMYYDVVRKNGVVIKAEMLTPVRDYQGLVRLKADVLRQVNEHNFVAHGAAVTTSRMGYPRYWLQTDKMEVQDRPQVTQGAPTIGQDGQLTVESRTDHEFWTSSTNNFVYMAGVPVFYWPYIRTNVQKPSFYLDRVRIQNDSIFGTQVYLDWDAYQLFGVRKREGIDWTLSTDFLSDRGPAIGTNVRYDRPGPFLGIGGRYHGIVDAWAIHDTGLDNLGADRRSLTPEETNRARILTQHRHDLGNGFRVISETGYVRDRNFLEQFHEQEWDEWKDQDSQFTLKRYIDGRMWQFQIAGHLNDFWTETEWLPRFDHYTIGRSVFDRLTWYEHSQVGYARLNVAETPRDPVDASKFLPMAWESEAEGVRAATRQELDLPFELGPVKLVPYVLGEAAHWGEDINNQSVTRTLGQAGIRANLPMWKVDPGIQSSLLNLNGMAHKVTWRAELLYADVSEDFTRFQLYDRLDDNNVESFRRRYPFDTFGGGPIPMRFDERNFALRSGLQRWVASPSTEIADDMMQTRLGVNQRWQTKRGLPGQERIVDWMVLDVEGIYFPKSDRDNFGEDIGMIDYDYRWHIGDRVAILSDGYADLFSDGLRTFSIGASMSRPDRWTLYIGYRSLEGPFSSNIFNAVLNYRMSQKWIATASATFDLGDAGNIGQFIGLTRIGESALVRVGFSVDESRGNVSARFTVEPRVFPNGRLGRVAGVPVPPPGVYGLE